MVFRVLCAAVLVSSAPAVAQEAPAAPAVPAEARRELKFQRPQTKGSTYRYSAKASLTSTVDVHVDDEVHPGGGHSLEVTLEGTLEITEVTPQFGNIAGLSLTVGKMTLTDDKGNDTGFASGTVITASVKDGEVVYTALGGEVEGHVKPALQLALPTILPVDEPQDAVMAPPGAVAPGDQWELDLVKLAEILKKARNDEIDPARSKATALYKGSATVDGLATDTIIASTNLVYTRIASFPDDYKLLSATDSTDSTTVLPQDPSVPYTPTERSVTESKSRFAIKQDGQELELEIKTHHEIRRSASPVR